jgi:hypothetical protein
LHALDRVLAGEQHRARTDWRRCLTEASSQAICPVPRKLGRTIPVRVALDPRYTILWDEWTARLKRTFHCVNALYLPTGIQWYVADVIPWKPGADRHDLGALLSRLQRDFPPDLKSVVMGITVWDESHVYRMGGGKIGLAQRGACVVPSWPRVENDCMILAHELAHLVGGEHVRGAKFLMSRAASTYKLPAHDPIGRVISRFRFHPRNLQTIRIYRKARFTKKGLQVPSSCRRMIRLIDRCWGI